MKTTMSCEITLKSSLVDLAKAKQVLFPGEKQETDESNNWSDIDSWTWKEDFDDPDKDSCTENWIQSCIVVSSPQAEIFVIAHKDRYVVFTSKWEKTDQQEMLKYQLTFPSMQSLQSPGVDELGDLITSCCCIPIKSLQKSSPGMPDWICVVLGFQSGCVKMLTVDGKLLMVESFHDEPVQQIRYHSTVNSSQQEVSILYSKVVIIVEAIGLLNTLRAFRNLLAKGQTLQGASSDIGQHHPPLNCKKFSLQDQERINDCFVLGTNSPNSVDHFITASTAGGFQARYNNSPPVASGIFSVGSHPYCAWHYAVEGSNAPLLTDVAYALASKVTSKLLSKTSGWLGWGGSTKTEGPAKPKDKQILEPATPVYPKYGFADALREALSVSVSPNHKLAAVTDSLGRIILVDLLRGAAVRMWKGYRDAQCGWVKAWEEKDHGSLDGDVSSVQRSVAFLVIYIAKRGLLEVWTAQQGVRVAAFNCVKGAVVMSMDACSFMGKELPQCCLLCPDGKIYEIIVPFQCALKGDGNQQKARDLHVLQQFRNLLQGENPSNFDLLLDIRHASLVNQGLDLLLDCQQSVDPDALVKCLESLIGQYSQAEALDAESRLLLSRCNLLLRIARVYIHLKDVRSRPPDYDTAVKTNISVEEIAGVLQLSVSDVIRVIPKNRGGLSTIGASDAALNVSTMEIQTFLRAFDLSTCRSDAEDCVRIKSSLSAAQRASLSTWIWGSAFSARSIDLVDELISVLINSLIVPADLVGLLVSYWLDDLNASAVSKLLHFHKLLRFLCQIAGPDNFKSTENVSPWWHNLGVLLSKTTKLEQAALAAIVCRSVIAEMEANKINKGNSNTKEDLVMEVDSIGEWEDMSIDMVQWNVLSKQLEDLTYLARLIRYSPVKLRENQRLLLDCPLKDVQDNLEFTLESILQKGRGSVTELVARWITQNLLEVEILLSRQMGTEDNQSTGIGDSDVLPDQAPEANKTSLEVSGELGAIQDMFHDLSQHLPYSTEHDVILLSVAVEYSVMWVKSTKHVKLIQRCLDTTQALKSNLLRHGICRTIWSVSLCPIFQELAVLMDKTGRLPKNFVSRKINLHSPDQAIPFLQVTKQLLDMTITSAMSSELESPPHIRYDDLWATCEGATPMIEVALRQRLVNIDLALLHHQLAQALFLLGSLEIKGVHAFSLFDQRVGRFAFFKDLHTYPPLPSQDCDPTVLHNRLHFLKQVVSKAVELVECNQISALDYINQAVKLGYEWGVDVDELRIKYVELLFQKGLDELAFEVLPSIGCDEKLASTLLAAAGRRLKQMLKPSDTSALSPMSASWLNSFPGDVTNAVWPESNPATTLSLLVEAMRRIPGDSSDQTIASELHSVLVTIQGRTI